LYRHVVYHWNSVFFPAGAVLVNLDKLIRLFIFGLRSF